MISSKYFSIFVNIAQDYVFLNLHDENMILLGPSQFQKKININPFLNPSLHSALQMLGHRSKMEPNENGTFSQIHQCWGPELTNLSSSLIDSVRYFIRL